MWHVHLKQVIRHSSECFNLQVSPLLCHSVNIFAWLHCWSIRIAKGVGILGCSSPLASLFFSKKPTIFRWQTLESPLFNTVWSPLPSLIWKILATPVKKTLSSKIFQKFPHTANIPLCKTQSHKEWCDVLSYLLKNH